MKDINVGTLSNAPNDIFNKHADLIQQLHVHLYQARLKNKHLCQVKHKCNFQKDEMKYLEIITGLPSLERLMSVALATLLSLLLLTIRNSSLKCDYIVSCNGKCIKNNAKWNRFVRMLNPSNPVKKRG